ncbi:MAG TPA: hypothetical protein VN940_07755 [Candidatus Dormibacteraeota bacterium]|nr:hypothetical protein [Candidatus Dormibacteraeota bacterium]
MSLRAEIHDALDEVTPPAPHLELRVTGLLDQVQDKKVLLPRGGRARWTRRFRGVVALVAAALVVVLIGGLMMEGRLLRDMNAPPQTISQAELSRLETRPLQFPAVKPGEACPVSPLTDTSAYGSEPLVFGTGPVYATPLGILFTRTNWGAWTILALQVEPTKASGLILIRARDLPTSALVVFTPYPFGGVLQPGDGIPTGRVIGSQVVQGETVQLYPELVIDTSRPYELTRKGDWPIYTSFIGYPKAATGCLGFQVDGVGTDGTAFTELLVLSA